MKSTKQIQLEVLGIAIKISEKEKWYITNLWKENKLTFGFHKQKVS